MGNIQVDFVADARLDQVQSGHGVEVLLQKKYFKNIDIRWLIWIVSEKKLVSNGSI